MDKLFNQTTTTSKTRPPPAVVSLHLSFGRLKLQLYCHFGDLSFPFTSTSASIHWLKRYFEPWSVLSIVVERPGVKSWLAYDEANGVMTCRFCLASNFDNNFTRGCRDLQRSALVRHINPIICKDHSRAVADAEQRKANAIAVQNVLTFEEAAVDKALKTVCWLAKEEVASMKFPSLRQLLTMFGDPDVHHLRAEDPTQRGMSLTSESSQFFYYQLAILLCKVWHEKVCLRSTFWANVQNQIHFLGTVERKSALLIA